MWKNALLGDEARTKLEIDIEYRKIDFVSETHQNHVQSVPVCDMSVYECIVPKFQETILSAWAQSPQLRLQPPLKWCWNAMETLSDWKMLKNQSMNSVQSVNCLSFSVQAVKQKKLHNVNKLWVVDEPLVYITLWVVPNFTLNIWDMFSTLSANSVFRYLRCTG